MTPRAIRGVAAVLARTSLTECRRLATRAADAADATSSRERARGELANTLSGLGL